MAGSRQNLVSDIAAGVVVVVGRAAEVGEDTDIVVALAADAAAEDTACSGAVVAMGHVVAAAGKDFAEVGRQVETAAVEAVYCHALFVVLAELHLQRLVYQGRHIRRM